jgi:hypothetical protein
MQLRTPVAASCRLCLSSAGVAGCLCLASFELVHCTMMPMMTGLLCAGSRVVLKPEPLVRTTLNGRVEGFELVGSGLGVCRD